MKSSIKYLCLISIFIFAPLIICADSLTVFLPDSLKEDLNSDVILRSFDSESLSAYSKDKEFIYDRLPKETNSIWDIIKRWLTEKFLNLLINKDTPSILTYFFYAIAIAFIIYLVMKLLKMDKLSFLYNESARTGFALTEEENIHEMSFDELIAEAVGEGNYRKAVRFYYLRTLKELSDRNFIDWKTDKTNREYVREIKEENLRNKFESLTLLFEFVWYGEFTTNLNEYEQAVVHFNQFIKGLKRG